MVKFCPKCNEPIDENNEEEKYAMIITKRGNKIIDFQCFHFQCWREFFEEAVQEAVKKKLRTKT